MLDKRTRRTLRMRNEYDVLMKMSRPGGILEITGNNGRNSNRYTVIFRIPTIVGLDSSGRPQYRKVSTVDIELGSVYPYEGTPTSTMRETPPWHPNWFPRTHHWCCGLRTSEHEPLWVYVTRMAETIRFNPRFTNVHSPATMDKDCIEFWNKSLHSNLFPTDTSPLPSPDEEAPSAGIVIHWNR